MPSLASDSKQHEAASTPSWKALFQFTVKKDIPILILASLSSVAAALAQPAQAYITGKVFDGFISLAAGSLSPDALVDQQRKWLLSLVGIAFGSWLFHSLEMSLWMIFGEMQAKNARTQLYRGLSQMDIAWFDLCKGGIDVLLPQLNSQIKELQTATSQPLGGILSLLSTTVAALAQAFYNSWDLTLVTLAGSPLIILAIFYFGSGMQTSIDKQQAFRAKALQNSLGALQNIETVKCFNAQDIECKKYMDEVFSASKWYRKIARSNATQMALLTFLVQSMFVQAFYYGGILIKNGKKKPSEVITTFFSAITAFQALQGVFPQLVVLEKGRFAGVALRAAMPRFGDTNTNDHGYRPMHCQGDIWLKDVCFSYPSRQEQLALDNVSLVIPGGNLTFLVGQSGSGKSTIGQLLVRFYDTYQGTILLDGEELTELDLHWLRSNITLVEQSSTIFRGSIEENIALGLRQDTKSSNVEAAIEFALLQKVIADMPEGINTSLEPSGQSVSGGQRQRIALARAKLRDTPILILDESTSALDQINRELMMDAIRQWRQGKTTIIVTHDITQIRTDDYAVVLRSGKIVQEGFRRDMETVYGSPFAVLANGSITERKTRYPHAEDKSHDVHNRTPSETAYTRRSTSFFTAAYVSLDTLPFHGLSVANMQRPPTRSKSSQETLEHRRPPERTTSTNESRTLSRRLQDFVQEAGLRAVETRSRGQRRRLVEKDFDPEKAVSPTPSQPGLLKMLRVMWHDLGIDDRTKMLFGYYGGTVHAACSPVFSFVLAKLLSLYSSIQDNSPLSLTYSMAILGIAGVDAIHTFIHRSALENTSQTWSDLLRQRAVRRLLDQPQEFFEKSNNTAALLAETLDHQVEEARNLFGRFLVMIYIAVVILTIAFVWAMSAQWKMTLIAITAGPYIFVVTKIYTNTSELLERQSNDAAQQINFIFTETFGKVRTVRSLTLESYFEQHFLAAIMNAMRSGRRRAGYTGLLYGMSTSAGTFATTLVFYVGTKLVHDGISVSSVIQVFAILILTISNVTMILEYVPQIGSAMEMAQRVLRLASLPETSHERIGDTRIMSAGLIEFKSLDFAYPSRPEVLTLKAVDLLIKPGITTAIVGGSGSGKSTIAKLLLKLYATKTTMRKRGITFSGRDLNQIDTTALRTITAVVAQSSPLFGTSVLENIVYGLPANSPYHLMEHVVEAAKQAGIHDYISSLPDTYQTLVGPGGVGLSGGQVQRIAIARALVRRPSLLILDEATSALDAESASLVRDTIHHLVRCKDYKMTIVMITHNRDMMEVADHVVVLEDGCVEEAGSFAHLLTQHGRLVNLLQGGAIE